MTKSHSNDEFELIFEGPDDGSPDTLRKLKATFLVELNMPVDKIQEVLANAPLTIGRSADRDELTVQFNALRAAGGKVLLLQSGTPLIETPPEDSGGFDEIEIGDPLDGEVSVWKENDTDDEELEVSHEPEGEEIILDLDLTPTSTSEDDDLLDDEDAPLFASTPSNSPPTSHAAPRVYELSLDDEPSDLLQKEDDGNDMNDTPLFAPDLLQKAAKVAEKQAAEIETLSLEFDDGEPATITPLPPKPSLEPPTSPPTLPPSLALSDDDGLDLTLHPMDDPEAHSSPTAIARLLEEVEEEESDLTIAPVDPGEGLSLSLDEPAPIPSHPSSTKVEGPKKIASEASDSNNNNKTVSDTSPSAHNVEAMTPLASRMKRSPVSAEVADAPQEEEKQPATPIVKEAETDPRRKTTRGTPWEIILPILIGGIILGAVNWFYFSGKQEEFNVLAQQAALLTANGGQKKVKNSENKTSDTANVPQPPSNDLVSSDTNTERTVVATINLDDESAIIFSARLETPAPAPLTAEEVGRKERPKPWIRKVEIDRIKILAGADGTFSEKAVAKIYVQDGKASTRLIGSVALNGRVDRGAKTGSVKLSLEYGPAQTEKTISIVRDGEASYGVHISADLSFRPSKN